MAVLAGELAVLLLVIGFALGDVVGAELDGAFGVEGGAGGGVEDLQTGPLDVVFEVELARPGGGGPAAEEVRRIPYYESRVARSHELLRSGRLPAAVVD